jgi:hypothetical protein
VKLEPGWVPVSSPPTASLATPDSAPATSNLVDLYQLWTTSGTWQTVRAWVSAHPPSRSILSESGGSYQYGTPLESSLTYSYTAVADHFESRQLSVAVAPLRSGGVGVRVDAQVIWYPSRSAAELIPQGTTRVIATVFRRSSPSDSTTVILKTATFTYPPTVKLLAQKVDSLPLAVPGPKSCPYSNGTGPQLELDFSGRPGVPKVEVNDDTNGCGRVSFIIGDTTEAPLTDGGLFHTVDQLLGLNLPTIDIGR